MILRGAQLKGAERACHAERSEMVRGASHLMKSKHPLRRHNREVFLNDVPVPTGKQERLNGSACCMPLGVLRLRCPSLRERQLRSG